MKIASSGNMTYCRWSNQQADQFKIQDTDPATFFQSHMSGVRQNLLNAQLPAGCVECTVMEQYNKVSGRQRQLLKTGITIEHFNKSLVSSPFVSEFKKSVDCDGHTDLMPVDWQIDLGNHCNSACVFCFPTSSSRLATEFVKLGLISQMPPRSWVEDPAALEKFLSTLNATPNLSYLHFIGGETLITPGFKKILQALVQHGLAQKITIGFTTNLTVWDEEINQLLCEFSQIQLGLSIESMTRVNDYVRWPSKIDSVTEILHRWIELSRQQNWITTIRTTPTALTAGELLDVYKFALAHEIGIESCNFLHKPEMLRMSVLPADVRQPIIDQLRAWIQQQQGSTTQIINTRNPDQLAHSLLQDAVSYVDYLENAPDQSDQLPKLVNYLKLLESSRGNKILDYLPEYEQLFRSAGY